ncbi:unnamed protein product [Linum trigynum]|uniref:Uncharacterized protein n=1 Tax=Linum trigynum TaxID=586398 RepID=A0AAV2E605_9ROSI
MWRLSLKMGLVAPGYQAGRAARYQLDEILKAKCGDRIGTTGLVVGFDMIGLVVGGIKSMSQQNQEQDNSNKTKCGVLEVTKYVVETSSWRQGKELQPRPVKTRRQDQNQPGGWRS